jgi:Mn2+/Fe2+ NRAMP family transporter
MPAPAPNSARLCFTPVTFPMMFAIVYLSSKLAQVTGKELFQLVKGFTLAAIGINAIDINPMKALVYAGIIQGFSTPPLLLMIVLMTNSRELMGGKTPTASG